MNLLPRPHVSAVRLNGDNGEDLGTETEAEKQLKMLLERQLEKNISLEMQNERQRNFTSSGPYRAFTEVSGIHSLTDFLSAKEQQQSRDNLRHLGLTEQEIDFLFQVESQQDDEPTQKKTKFGVEPEAAKERIKSICMKLNCQDISMGQNEISFSGTKQLTRHEMDIEKSLYAGCKSKSDLKEALISNTKLKELHPMDPFKAVGELSQKLMKLRKKKRKQEDSKNNSNNVDVGSDKVVSEDARTETEKPDPTKLHVVVPLEKEEIIKNQLTVEQIREIPRFKDYDAGLPNKVLYLKNLHPSVDVRNLIAIFSRFDPVDGEPVSYRLLKGRMKGQAFVTFPDEATAKSALEFANGYVLRGKPLIICYGRARE